MIFLWKLNSTSEKWHHWTLLHHHSKWLELFFHTFEHVDDKKWQIFKQTKAPMNFFGRCVSSIKAVLPRASLRQCVSYMAFRLCRDRVLKLRGLITVLIFVLSYWCIQEKRTDFDKEDFWRQDGRFLTHPNFLFSHNSYLCASDFQPMFESKLLILEPKVTILRVLIQILVKKSEMNM